VNYEHDELTHVIEAWLDTTEPNEDPAAVFDRVIGELDSIPQRGSSWLAWRFPVMSNPVRIALAAAAVIAVGFLAISLPSATPQPGGGPSQPADDPSLSASATPENDLGVFEPARGRIVYRVGSHLEAVDPEDPSSPVVIEPVDTSPWAMPPHAMPAGWSADGTKLAITDEDGEVFYVMDRTGSLERVAEYPQCCWFVTSAWMSPDGTERLGYAPSLEIIDLVGNRPSRVIGEVELSFQHPMSVWSPDSLLVAYIWSKGGDSATPAVGIIDLTSGARRELISGWGLIRQLVWSPDGSQILVVAGPTAPDLGNRTLNPLTNPQPASLYLVDVDDGEAHEVAWGHYLAAAWSPDGTRIAAMDYVGGYHRVVVVNADGSGDRQVLAELAGNGYLFTGVVWHPVPAP